MAQDAQREPCGPQPALTGSSSDLNISCYGTLEKVLNLSELWPLPIPECTSLACGGGNYVNQLTEAVHSILYL